MRHLDHQQQQQDIYLRQSTHTFECCRERVGRVKGEEWCQESHQEFSQLVRSTAITITCKRSAIRYRLMATGDGEEKEAFSLTHLVFV